MVIDHGLLKQPDMNMFYNIRSNKVRECVVMGDWVMDTTSI